MKTDFKSWERATLEKFARQVADEHLVLTEKIKATAWRPASELIDSRGALLLFDGSLSDYPIWPGSYEAGIGWAYCDAHLATPTHWMPMPAGPYAAPMREENSESMDDIDEEKNEQDRRELQQIQLLAMIKKNLPNSLYADALMMDLEFDIRVASAAAGVPVAQEPVAHETVNSRFFKEFTKGDRLTFLKKLGGFSDGLMSEVRTHWDELRLFRAVFSQPSADDALRLDFMITHGAWIAWSKDHEKCRVFHHDDDGESAPMMGWVYRAWHHKPADAIDAAIKAKP